MMSGQVVVYFPERAFGFISADGEQGKKNRFFHKNNFVVGEPKVGMRVKFELGAAVKLNHPEQCVNIAAESADEAQKASVKAGQ